MSRPPSARSRIIVAFVQMLIEDGERATTVEAVAQRAGVSKGGLLYHFGSKEQLVDGLIERLREAGRADLERMSSADDGAVAYYLTSSVDDTCELAPLYVAASRLTGESRERAQAAINELESGWLDLLRGAVGDEETALLINLVGDGLYLGVIQGAGEGARAQLNTVLPLITRLAQQSKRAAMGPG